METEADQPNMVKVTDHRPPTDTNRELTLRRGQNAEHRPPPHLTSALPKNRCRHQDPMREAVTLRICELLCVLEDMHRPQPVPTLANTRGDLLSGGSIYIRSTDFGSGNQLRAAPGCKEALRFAYARLQAAGRRMQCQRRDLQRHRRPTLDLQ